MCAFLVLARELSLVLEDRFLMGSSNAHSLDWDTKKSKLDYEEEKQAYRYFCASVLPRANIVMCFKN